MLDTELSLYTVLALLDIAGPMGGRLAAVLIAMFIAIAPACSNTAPARAQLLVVVDTDAPLVGQLSSHPEISPDAAVDTLRVDVLDAQNSTRELQTFVVGDRGNWPVSFGVQADGAADVRLRIYLFRRSFGSPATETKHATATVRAPSQVTIERFARVQFPTEGIRRVRIVLHEDCMGTPPSFATPNTTCIDADHLAGAPTDGIDLSSGAPLTSQVGSWKPAVETPCGASPPANRICVPGGFSILGDLDLVGLLSVEEDPAPLRPVIVSPFLFDKFEYTVGRFRALLQRGAFSGLLPLPRNKADPIQAFCSWLGPDDPSHDQLPLNCVEWATADLACRLDGGALPSEAEWEHAARGRGQRLRYPWGNGEASCCTASLNRKSVPASIATCPGDGLEPVGSHPAAACGDATDISRDGVVDLGGSVRELLADKFGTYADPCWSRLAILHNPVCDTTTTNEHCTRGSDWSAGLGSAIAALRDFYAAPNPNAGFRCKYPVSQ